MVTSPWKHEVPKIVFQHKEFSSFTAMCFLYSMWMALEWCSLQTWVLGYPFWLWQVHSPPYKNKAWVGGLKKDVKIHKTVYNWKENGRGLQQHLNSRERICSSFNFSTAEVALPLMHKSFCSSWFPRTAIASVVAGVSSLCCSACRIERDGLILSCSTSAHLSSRSAASVDRGTSHLINW